MTIFRNVLFDPAPDTPLYQQLYAHLRVAILSGELKRGTKLPSARALAVELNVSRNTILNAYRQLTAEGYLESAEGSGTFVAGVLPDLLLKTTPVHKVPTNTLPLRSESSEPLLSKHAEAQLAVTKMTVALSPPSGGVSRPLRSETPALDTFPYKLWSRLAIRRARQMPGSAFT
jgi:GntR family transcriptional regulator/MocR family aminotransferase